jgi:hypothetical protein
VHPERREKIAIISIELGVIGLVAATLVVLENLIPAQVESQLILQIGEKDPNPVTLITASYFHVDPQQLRGNIFGYAVGALFTYILCVFIGERQWYWLTFFSMLFLIPLFVNLSNLYVFSGVLPNVPSRGFSDVASGFAGFLLVALLAFIRSQYSRITTGYVGMIVVVVLMVELLLIYSGSPSLLSIGLVTTALLLSLFEIARQGNVWQKRESIDWVDIVGMAFTFFLIIVIIMMLIKAMFPAEIASSGQFTNIFAHAMGFLLGVVISGWGKRYWAKQDW